MAAPAVLVALALACVAVRLALLRALVAVALVPLLAAALVRFAAGLAAAEVFFELDDERFGAGIALTPGWLCGGASVSKLDTAR